LSCWNGEATGLAPSGDEAGFIDGTVAGGSAGKPEDVAGETGPDCSVPMFAAFMGPAGDDDEAAEGSCGTTSETLSDAAGTGTSAGKSKVTIVLDANEGLFFCESFVLRKFAVVVLPTAFCEPSTPAVGTAGVASFAGGVESWEARMAAAKPPVLRAGELAEPTKAEARTGAALLVFADSMVEVTVRVNVDAKAHPAWMHLMRQSDEVWAAANRVRNRSGIKEIRILPMEAGAGRRVHSGQGLPRPGRI
jgi:hypothetical protein